MSQDLKTESESLQQDLSSSAVVDKTAVANNDIDPQQFLKQEVFSSITLLGESVPEAIRLFSEARQQLSERDAEETVLGQALQLSTEIVHLLVTLEHSLERLPEAFGIFDDKLNRALSRMEGLDRGENHAPALADIVHTDIEPALKAVSEGVVALAESAVQAFGKPIPMTE